MSLFRFWQSKPDQDDKISHVPVTSPLSQSRETGKVIPELQLDVAPVTTTEELAVKPWAHFLGGAVGGMTAATLTSPLDVLKTRLQSDFYQGQLRALHASHQLSTPHTPLQHALGVPRAAYRHLSETLLILASIQRNEGIRGLFRGLGANLVGVVPARAINFYVYGNCKRIYGQVLNPNQLENVWSVHLLAAATAGIATGTATNPIWVVKTRLQLDKNAAAGSGKTRQYKNSWDCIKQTVRHEGIKGLYRGLSASYLGVTESTLQWVLYERMKLALKRRADQRLANSSYQPTTLDAAEEWGGKLTAAGAAKLFAAALTYPHEVVRTRLRQAPVINVAGGKAEMKYKGLVQCFVTVAREEGLAGLYGGMTPHLLRVVPSAAIMFGMYELTLRLCGTTS